MPLGADDMQAAGLDDRRVAPLPLLTNCLMVSVFACCNHLSVEIAAEHDVSTATGHIRGNCNRAGAARLLHDDGFALMLLRIEHFVIYFLLLQEGRQQFRGFNRGRTNQHRLATLTAIGNVLDDCIEFILLRQVDEVGVILAYH